MAIWDRLFRTREKDTASIDHPPNWFMEWIGGGSRAHSGVRVTVKSALGLSMVWACVRVKSEDVGKLPTILYRRLPGGGKARATDDPRYHLIHDRPNPLMTAFQFKQMLQMQLDLRGDAFALKEFDGRGRVVALWPVPSEHVEVLCTPDHRDLFYRVTIQGKQEVYPAEAVLHLRGLSLNGITGLSPIAYHRETIGLGIAAQEYGSSFFGNSAQPRGAIKMPTVITAENAERLRSSWEEKYKGVENAHKLAIFDGGMEYVQTGMNNSDAEYILTRKIQNSEICRIYRMPPHKVGDLEKATFCLPANAKVFTSEGPKRIADVKVGEAVWSRSETREWVTALVERSEPTGIDRILRIVTTNRTLRLNAKHRVLVRRAREIPLRPGQTGGRNVHGRKVRVEWTNEYVEAGNISVGDVVVTLSQLPDRKQVTAPNGRNLTSGFMAFCGLLVGDGNVFASGSISIARSQTAPYMDFYRNVAACEFTVGGRDLPRGEDHHQARLSNADVVAIRAALDAGEARKEIASEYSVSRATINSIASGRNWGPRHARPTRPIHLREAERQTRFNSKAATEELIALGFGGTARTKRVPGWVFGLSEDLRLAFLAGYLDADGSVDKLGRMAFHSVSADLVDDVRHLCMSLGIPVTNARRAAIHTRLPNGEYFAGEISVFTCSDPGQNRRVPTATPLYAERMAAGRPFGRKDRKYPHHGGAGFVEPGCSLSRISDIIEEPAEPVYDLAVRGTHNFIADGVVVHNSNIEQQSLEYVTDCLLSSLVSWEQTLNEALLLEDERQEYFFEFLVDALLRGDMKSRFEAYGIARMWGLFCVDDIMEIENRNPLPDGKGKIFLQPLNMVEAGTVPPQFTPDGAKALLAFAKQLVAREELTDA